MSYLGDLRAGLIAAMVIVVLATLLVFWVITKLMSPNNIKSYTRIEPKIELIINNNQVDTLFVYELK